VVAHDTADWTGGFGAAASGLWRDDPLHPPPTHAAGNLEMDGIDQGEKK
jgi:hypothetical protein